MTLFHATKCCYLVSENEASATRQCISVRQFLISLVEATFLLVLDNQVCKVDIYIKEYFPSVVYADLEVVVCCFALSLLPNRLLWENNLLKIIKVDCVSLVRDRCFRTTQRLLFPGRSIENDTPVPVH